MTELAEMTITRSPRGEARREVKLQSLAIPDLWHIYQAMLDPKSGFNKKQAEDVLEAWYLCHDLKANLLDSTLVKGGDASQ